MWRGLELGGGGVKYLRESFTTLPSMLHLFLQYAVVFKVIL